MSHAPSPPPLTQRSGDILLPAVIALAAMPERPPFWIWNPSVCVCPQRCGYNQGETDITQHLIGRRRRPIRAPQRRGVLDGGPADVCCIRSKVTDRSPPPSFSSSPPPPPPHLLSTLLDPVLMCSCVFFHIGKTLNAAGWICTPGPGGGNLYHSLHVSVRFITLEEEDGSQWWKKMCTTAPLMCFTVIYKL